MSQQIEKIFQEEEEEHLYTYKQRQQHDSQSRNQPQLPQNVFMLTDDVRNNINKRLPRGFILLKVNDVPKSPHFNGDIQYVPEKKNTRVASQTLAKQFVIQTQLPSSGKRQSRAQDKGLRFGQLPQGKSKQGQKIKTIIQKFRKHQKYNQLHQHLTRLGFASALNEIENQNRKNIHTIQSFKDRILFLLTKAHQVTAEYDKQALINEMIDELQFLVQNAQKSQFSNSLVLIQKSLDKITRQISQIRETGSFYYKRKKRSQKNYDQKELVYIASLIRQLPSYQLVGVLQIIEEKPFSELGTNKLDFHLNGIKHKKIRQIEHYVKKKLSNRFKSKERKLNKIKNKLEEKKNQIKQKMVNQRKSQKGMIRNQEDLHLIFQNQDIHQENKIYEPEQQLDSFSIPLQNPFMPDQLPSDQNDDLFNPNERRSSVSVRSRNSNMEFQPIPPVSSPPKEEEEPDHVQLTIQEMDSDSSYITDEEDSDF